VFYGEWGWGVRHPKPVTVWAVNRWQRTIEGATLRYIPKSQHPRHPNIAGDTHLQNEEPLFPRLLVASASLLVEVAPPRDWDGRSFAFLGTLIPLLGSLANRRCWWIVGGGW
jgi:hypothetical protein